MPVTSRLTDLIALAEQPSSERRRELLRSITDLFFVHDGHGANEMALYDDVMSRLAGDMEAAVRAELAERMAAAPAAPSTLLRNLASDQIEVARPVLEQASGLSEADLMHVARTQGQEHLRAISQRPAVPIAVSDVIVERGDDSTLGVLLGNEGAALSREAHEKVVDRAAANPALHEIVIDRQSLPVDLLNEMYFMVEAQLRDRIMARNATIDPAELEAALEAGRKRVAALDGALPADYAEAEAAIRAMKARGDITPRSLAAMLRNREMTRFLLALAELADIDFHTAKRIIDRRELDALAIVCRAADFDRSLFLTFAVLILDRDADAMGKAKTYGELYAALPRETATRTVRFWRMRRTTGDVAAA
jgi:uncharacterized protein (DUF2336 family)